MNEMSPPTTQTDIAAVVSGLGQRARSAAQALSVASIDQRNTAVTEAANALRARTAEVLAANAKDVEGVQGSGKDAAFIDRLTLTEDRVAAMAMIYESRPNVGSDAGALCIKSGNAVILRGGSESLHSSRVIVDCLTAGLKAAGLPEDAVQLVDTRDREAVKHLLHSTEHVDLVIPRGGRGLVSLVQREARVPTLLHLDGNNHTYVHHSADLEMAAGLVRNAKMRRTGICGATECVVVDAAIADTLLPKIAGTLGDCELRGDARARSILPDINPASDEDWDTEYLSNILSIKVVGGLDEAIGFVQAHSSGHTDAIVAGDGNAAQQFLTQIDSAVVMHNASTQFSDGGEFGMGAEIGIATGKMHARGPVGAEQLTSFKYLVHGSGQQRP